MVCGKFIVKDTVQDVGVRAKIITNTLKGISVEAWNIKDGSVEVYAQSNTEKEIEKFTDIIKDMAKKGELGKGKVKVSEVTFNEHCEVDKLMYSDRLICEQMSKFIEVGEEIRDNLKSLPKEIAKAIKK